MTEVLTPAQARVWHYIADHVLQHGYAPSLRGMCDAFNIRSTNGMSDHVRRLRRKGY